MDDSAADSQLRGPRSRKSIAHVPFARTPALKDNATTDIAAIQAQHNAEQAARKKSRGKSLGPGGLEALKETNANVAQVGAILACKHAHCA